MTDRRPTVAGAARLATSSTTIGEVLAEHDADLAIALGARDWARVGSVARRLKMLDRMAELCGPDAGYLATLLSGRAL